MKSWKLYILIIVLSVFPLIDIFRTPDLPHTSDGAMHLARFAAYYKEAAAGQFPVRWASQFNYGYGTPFFNFFHPLPYMVGLPFVALGLPLVLILKVSFAITYILAGVFMLLFCRAYFKDTKTAFFITVMYQYSPFRLVDMLVRGSLGSLYSYVILPIVFYAITRYLEKKTYFYFTLLAVSTALLAASHNIIGFVFFGISVLYVPFATKNIKKIGMTYFAMAAGLALAGFFLIPAILEHKYTNGYLFTKDLFYEHFTPLYKFVLPNITDVKNLRTAEVPVQIGLFHVLAYLIAIFLLMKNKLAGKTKMLAIYLLLVSFITILFMLSITKVIWENISFLRQFQFPWRLMSIICFTSAMASSFAIMNIRLLRKNVVYVGLICLVILSTIYYWVPYQGYQKISQDYYWNYPKSTNYFGEINTIWMAHEPVEYPKKRIDVISGQAIILNIKLLPEKHTYQVNAINSAAIVDKTYFYPGWRVTEDTISVPIQFQDQNYRGLITFNVPQGKHMITVQYTENLMQRMSDLISIIVFGCLLIGSVISLRKKLNEKTD